MRLFKNFLDLCSLLCAVFSTESICESCGAADTLVGARAPAAASGSAVQVSGVSERPRGRRSAGRGTARAAGAGARARAGAGAGAGAGADGRRPHSDLGARALLAIRP